MAKQYATRDAAERKARPLQRPIAGTKLIREYQGVEHCVTVRADDFEYLGRPYKSLSSIAREITGTQWNGLVFLDSSVTPGEHDAASGQTSPPGRWPWARRRPAFRRQRPAWGDPQAALRRLYAQIQRGRPRDGVQLIGRPARGLPGLYRKPARGRLGSGCRPLRRRRRVRRHARSPCP